MPELTTHTALPTQAAASPSTPYQPTLQQYAGVGASFVAFGLFVSWIIEQRAALPVQARQLAGPMFALTLLISVVWLLMATVRNVTILRGLTSAQYYVDYHSTPPSEWVERPARTFNNLMQAPQLFYALCLTMFVSNTLDGAQLALAWVFVAARVAHALVYIGWNYVPARFALWNVGFATLVVMWIRFALQFQLW